MCIPICATYVCVLCNEIDPSTHVPRCRVCDPLPSWYEHPLNSTIIINIVFPVKNINMSLVQYYERRVPPADVLREMKRRKAEEKKKEKEKAEAAAATDATGGGETKTKKKKKKVKTPRGQHSREPSEDAAAAVTADPSASSSATSHGSDEKKYDRRNSQTQTQPQAQAHTGANSSTNTSKKKPNPFCCDGLKDVDIQRVEAFDRLLAQFIDGTVYSLARSFLLF